MKPTSLRIPWALIALSLSLSFLPGCSLLPKKVEFGQAKVPAYPEKTDKQKELERQTADALVKKTQEVKDAVIFYEDPPEVVKPAQEATKLAQGLSTALGPPSAPWTGPSDALVARLEAAVARQNQALEKLSDKLDKYEGKKIEGTGVVQLPYFVYLGIVAAGLALLVALIHAGVNIGAMLNPGVAAAKVALNVAEAGAAAAGTLAIKTAKQVVAGGGAFIKDLEGSAMAQSIKDDVKKLFATAQSKSQDADVKETVKSLPGAVKLP